MSQYGKNRRRTTFSFHHTVYTPEMARDTRKSLRTSQSIFAKFLGVSVSLVRHWERGASQPSKMASLIMDEINRDPEHWFQRFYGSIQSNELNKLAEKLEQMGQEQTAELEAARLMGLENERLGDDSSDSGASDDDDSINAAERYYARLAAEMDAKRRE